MHKRLTIPLEFWLIVLPSLGFFIYLFSTLFTSQNNTVSLLSGSGIASFLSSGIFYVFVVGIWSYVVLKLVRHVHHKKTYRALLDTFTSGLGLSFVVLCELSAIAFSTLYLYAHQSAAHVAHISNIYMMLDKKIFGVYPAFFIHKIDYPVFLDTLIVYSYQAAFFFLLGVVVAALLRNKKLFRLLLLSLFISHMIAYVFWAVFPSIAPSEMYRLNILQTDISPDISQALLSVNYSQNVKKEIDAIDTFWIDPEGKMLSVSTNPSMHIVWAVLILYVAMSLWRPSGAVVIPWFIFNMIGTVFTMQHYGIDIIAGLILGVGVIYCVKKALDWEEKIYPSHHFFSIIDALQADAQKILKHILFK